MKGEEFEINVKFPEEYHAEELKGKDAVFKVKINSIKFKELPELDDEFVQDVSEFETLDEFKKDTREKLTAANEEREKNENEHSVVDAVCANTQIDIPEAMINSQIDTMIRDMDMQLRYQGITLEQYMQFTGQTMDAVREQYKPEAEKSVKTTLVLEKVADVENFEITDEDVENEYNRICEENGMKPEDVKKYISVDSIKERLKAQKAIEFLVNNANIK